MSTNGKLLRTVRKWFDFLRFLKKYDLKCLNLHQYNSNHRMEYKYKTTIEQYNLADCPPEDGNILPCECYHYVFEDKDHRDNFLPISERDPKRINNLKDIKKCALIGLSCYLSEKEAVDKWNRYNKYPDYAFEQNVGTFLCRLLLKKEDGTTSKDKETTTHFNFYEYHHVNLKSQILEMKPIPKNQHDDKI